MLWSAAAWASVPFPAEERWQTLSRGGLPVEDAAGDAAPAALDLAGDAKAPVLRWDADPDALFLRVQLAGSPDDGAWAVLLDLDANAATFERALLVEGPTLALSAWTNATGAPGTWAALADPLPLGEAATGEVRAVDLGGRTALDLQVARDTLRDALGVFDATPIRVAAVSADDWAAGLADVAGCAGACADLALASADPVTVDLDGDGSTDPDEARRATDPLDADTDDDGLADGDEAASDPLACDSDGDGLPDGLEAGVAAAGAATDLAALCFRADADPASTTDPTLADTDGGGRPDPVEDADHDGAVGPWETDPADPSDDPDGDGDDVPDVFDDLWGAGADADSDGDGIDDALEGLGDADADGLPAFADDDTDGDGFPDAVEGAVDTDADLLPDFRDPDSDGDGLPDAVEGDADTDGDELLDRVDPDADGDAIADGIEGLADTDGDTVPDWLDDDSDGDGIADATEGAVDTDGDTALDFRDLDSDDDGITDAIEGAFDHDDDGDFDFRDPDSDGDAILDRDEAPGDEDCDGRENRIDGDPEDSFCDEPTIPPVGNGAPPDERRPPPDPFAAPGEFGGGACASAPSGRAPVLALVLVLLVLSRRAAAQEVNADRFLPSIDGGPLVKVEDAAVAEEGTGQVALWMVHADDPLVFRPHEGEPVPILSAVTTARLSAAYALPGLVVGAELPLHLYTSGWEVERPTNLGDLRLAGKLGLFAPEPAGLALFADLALPTGAAGAWLGAGTAVARGGLVATARSERVVGSIQLGARTGTGETLGTLRVSPAVVWAAGAAFELGEVLTASLEADGEAWLGNPGESGALPVEALATIRQTVADLGALAFGAGTGLSRGLGAPDFRLVAGFVWEP